MQVLFIDFKGPLHGFKDPQANQMNPTIFKDILSLEFTFLNSRFFKTFKVHGDQVNWV